MFTCKILLITVYLMLVMFCHSAIAKHSKTFKQMSDTLCVFTPAVALTASVFKEEPEKSGVYLLQLLSQEAFVEGAKTLFSHSSLGMRPSDKGKDESSGFISSHVSATTAGAIKLWQLYPDNYWVNTSSVLAVALVGVQRIEGEHHTPVQVGLGIGTAFLFDYLGAKLSALLFAQKEVEELQYVQEPSNYSFSFQFPDKGDGLVALLHYSF